VSRVYATVPATSTQGDIKLEDKIKQAVGGIQLVRLSFPPLVDMNEVEKAINSSVKYHFTGIRS
jgi:cysteine synthase A